MTVKQIQHLLAFHGYYSGAIDGIIGAMTQKAVAGFQRDFGLEADGVVGQQTEGALRHAVCYGMPQPEKKEEADGWDGIRWFTRNEFACKCGLYHDPYCDGFPAEMDMRVVNICEKVREHFGVPVEIVSGLRCEQHNFDSDGVVNSQHMDGTACDIYVRGVSASAVEAYLDEIGGIRYYYNIKGSQNVHFDVPRGG